MATTRKNKLTMANLWLWHVSVEYDKYVGDRGHTVLRITTATHSIDRAIKKARGHVNRNRHDWPGAKIDGCELQGRLHA